MNEKSWRDFFAGMGQVRVLDYPTMTGLELAECYALTGDPLAWRQGVITDGYSDFTTIDLPVAQAGVAAVRQFRSECHKSIPIALTIMENNLLSIQMFIISIPNAMPQNVKSILSLV